MANNSDSVTTTSKEMEANIKLGFYIGTLILGFIGNTLVIAVILGKKKQRTIYDHFILNLGISDLSFIVFCLPIYIYEYFRAIYQTLAYCRVVPSLLTVVYFLSIFTITSMAIHRCRLIVNPYKPKPPKRTAYISISVIWASSFVIVLPLSVVATSKDGVCDEQWPSMNHRRAYTLSLSILQFFLPLLIIAGAYLKIGIYLWRSTAPQSSLSTEKQKKNQKRKRENMQVIKTLAAIVILFAILLLPGQIAWLMLDFGTEDGRAVAKVIFKFSDILDCLHACVNPIIYGLLTEQFRREYIRYFSYCFLCGTKKENKKNDSHGNESSKGNSPPVRPKTKMAKTETLDVALEWEQNETHSSEGSKDAEKSSIRNYFPLQETSLKYTY